MFVLKLSGKQIFIMSLNQYFNPFLLKLQTYTANVEFYKG